MLCSALLNRQIVVFDLPLIKIFELIRQIRAGPFAPISTVMCNTYHFVLSISRTTGKNITLIKEIFSPDIQMHLTFSKCINIIDKNNLKNKSDENKKALNFL